jgi:hypothetical protein
MSIIKNTEADKVLMAIKFLEKRGWLVIKKTETGDSPSNKYPPLSSVTKPSLTTDEAAFYLNRKAQTLRAWACKSGDGPIKPVHIYGRNSWLTSDVRKLLG